MNRLKSQGERSGLFVSYAVTIAFIAVSLIPLAWMASSSLKSNLSIYAFPPKWIPPLPGTISITLDYAAVNGSGRDFYELDAMEAIWFSWKKHQNEPIGEIRVDGVSGGRLLYSARMPAYSFESGRAKIVPGMVFTDQVMARKLPIIREEGYTSFKWYGEDSGKTIDVAALPNPEAAKQDSPSEMIASFLQSSRFLKSELVSIEQKPNIWRLFDNYITIFDPGKLGEGIGFLHFFKNSVIVTFVTILLQFVIGGMAGYALSQLISGKWKVWLLLFFVATLMIPEVAVLIPLYLTIEKLNLVNTLWGIILPHSAWGLVVFLFKGFFDQLPSEAISAARVDGAGDFRIFFQLVIPMSIPVFTIVAVMTFIPMWNEFLWPLVVARDQEVWTFTVALRQLQTSLSTNVLMASMILATVPLFIVFLTCQKFIEKGISWTGSKS